MRYWIIGLLMFGLILGGCSSEKTQVTNYVHQSDDLLRELMALGDEFKNLDRPMGRDPAGMAQEVASRKQQLKGMRDKVHAINQKLRALKVPEKATKLSELELKAIDGFESTMTATDEVLGELGKGPGINKMKVMGLMAQVQQSFKGAAEAAREAHQERQHLIDEFQIKVETPAPTKP